MSQEKYTIFWFRRDLRLDDNIGFYRALQSDHNRRPTANLPWIDNPRRRYDQYYSTYLWVVQL